MNSDSSTSDPRRLAGMTPYQAGLLFLLVTATGWGLNWAVLKFVTHYWPPLFARSVAGLIAGVGLMLWAMFRGHSLAVPRALFPRLGIAAAINVFVWMGFTALSLRWLKVAEAALLSYTMPIWATLLAWPLRGERPTTRTILAVFLGVSGLVVLMGGASLNAGALAPGIALALSAAILFALGTVMAGTPMPLPPVVLTAWQVTLGCIPMLALSLLVERPNVGALSGPGIVGLAYIAIGPMALCYLTWFAALRRLPTATAATGMLLVPIVGTIAAAILVREPLGLRQFCAFALTLSGVALALRQR
jgi:drug/metabolite transporter (DMT)-like permease